MIRYSLRLLQHPALMRTLGRSSSNPVKPSLVIGK